MASRASRPGTLAADAWRAMFDFFLANRDRTIGLAAEYGLTVGPMRTLLSLDADEPQSMRALAESWKCDASNVTWLVDRLEERQLVERRTSPTDRRVKTVALTAAGEALKAELLARMYEPPPQLQSLPAADLQALRRIFAKLR